MEKQQKYRNNYLYTQLISYIGNKRKLIPLIEKVFEDCNHEKGRPVRFLDPFSGSGVVSRLANTMGFDVFANDWEPYGNIINRCYLQNRPSSIMDLFKPTGQTLSQWVLYFNQLQPPLLEEEYIARYYSTRQMDPSHAEVGRERLFYTRQNGLILDKIRNELDVQFPDDPENQEMQLRRSLILGPLLYQASKHTNTSGVFKAYHKGFGGYGKDALSRILNPITLEEPVLWESQGNNQVFNEDANQLVRHCNDMDICYLDPPYNQHQYGSNYHMLNTLVLWDKIPQPLEMNHKGELKRKAGIREDWKKTHSSYCRKDKAAESFRDLLDNLDARYTIISYSTDGIIPLEEMRELCENKGKVELYFNDYAVYRGGRQSNSRKHRNMEFLWVIKRGQNNTSLSRKRVDRHLIIKNIQLLYQEIYRKTEMNTSSCPVDLKQFLWVDGWKLKEIQGLFQMSIEQLRVLKEYLEEHICHTNDEALQYLLTVYHKSDTQDKKAVLRIIPRLLKKLAHPKTSEIYSKGLKEIYDWAEKNQIMEHLEKKLNSIDKIAKLRLKK